MLHFSKAKILFISLICLASIIYAAPSMLIGSDESFVQKILPQQKVNLGLDLRGGSQLMLEVDFDYYVKEQLTNLRDEIKNSFRDEFVRVVPELAGSKIIFTLTDEEQKKLAKKLIKKLSGNVEVAENSGQFQVYFSEAELVVLKQNLIKQ